MEIIPAVDLRGGKVVRLIRGDFGREKTYSEAPEDVVLKWQLKGASLVHVVDLDGALTGRRKNIGSLKNICRVAKVPIQFGGGLRSIQAVEEVLRLGVSRVVLGTKAMDLKLLKELIKRFHQKIAVGLDLRDGRIQVDGWKKQIHLVTPDSFCHEIERIGVQWLIFTDVSRDGTLLGPNMEGLQAILKMTSMNVIASGGISSLDDLKRLKSLFHPNFFGVIVGKALYEKCFELTDAIRLAKS